MRARAWLALALLLAGCTSAPAAPAPQATLAACAAIASPGPQLACLQPLFSRAMLSRDERGLLDDLRGLVKDGTLDDCHVLAHHFGMAAFDATQNASAAIALGSDACLNGYYHGVMEEALRERALRGELAIDGLCDAITNASAYDGCVHGLGHGLMARSGENVTSSVGACHKLLDAQADRRCTDGVIMEDSMQFLELPEADYLARAPGACPRFDALTPRQNDDCAREVGEVAMLRYHHDLARADALCARVPGDGRAALCDEGARNEAATRALES